MHPVMPLRLATSIPKTFQGRCTQDPSRSQALAASVSSTRSVIGAGQNLGVTGKSALGHTIDTSRSFVLQRGCQNTSSAWDHLCEAGCAKSSVRSDAVSQARDVG